MQPFSPPHQLLQGAPALGNDEFQLWNSLAYVILMTYLRQYHQVFQMQINSIDIPFTRLINHLIADLAGSFKCVQMCHLGLMGYVAYASWWSKGLICNGDT